MNKLFVCGTDEAGETCAAMAHDKTSYLPIAMGKELGFPKNALIIVECEVIEGMRTVTSEERSKYPSPEEAMYWHVRQRTLARTSLGGVWDDGKIYFVPKDFTFEKTKPPLIVFKDWLDLHEVDVDLFWKNCKRKNQRWVIESHHKKRSEMFKSPSSEWLSELFFHDASLQRGVEWIKLAQKWKQVCASGADIFFGFKTESKWVTPTEEDVGKPVRVSGDNGPWLILGTLEGILPYGLFQLTDGSIWPRCRMKRKYRTVRL